MPELNRSLNQPRNMSTSTLPVAPTARYSGRKETIIHGGSSQMRERKWPRVDKQNTSRKHIKGTGDMTRMDDKLSDRGIYSVKNF